MKKLVVCLTVLSFASALVFSREPKEYDSDVIYDESKVPHYDLPPLLVTAEGKTVETAEEWMNIRRPQILALFSNLVYGRVPKPESPIKTEFTIIKTDPKFMGGKATRKDVRIRLSNDKGKAEMLVLVFVPNNAAKPVPAFMKHSFNDTKSRDFDVHSMWPGRLRNGWPIGKFFERGYAFVAVYQQDLVGHNEVEFLRGIHRLFYKKGQSFPKAHEWGVLSAVAWGAMRAMDYLETDDDVDEKRVAIMGHSKMGKATLWCGPPHRMSALHWRFRRSRAARGRLYGGGAPARHWKKWSPDFRTGSAGMRGSLSAGKTICRSISTCCWLASRRGRFMCTAASKIHGRTDGESIYRPTTPAKCIACSERKG